MTPAPRPGIWTPWADVLCVPCHNRHSDLTSIPFKAASEGLPGGVCDDCGTDVLLPGPVALLAWPRREVPGGQLAQTGGMCPALSFSRGAVARVVVGAELEQDEPVFLAGVYDEGHVFPAEATLDEVARGREAGVELVRRLVAEYMS